MPDNASLTSAAARALEVFALKDGAWVVALFAGGDDKISPTGGRLSGGGPASGFARAGEGLATAPPASTAPPFEDLELDLGELWAPDPTAPQ